MKTYIRRREQNEHLVVVYGGWGTDEHVFAPFCNDEFDFILFYEYSADEALVLPEMKTYSGITVIGWSLGVWAAEYLAPKTRITPTTTIAVNGTPYPADDRYGIPLSVFEGTLNNISEKNMVKFYLRMFGDKKTYRLNMERIPQRSIKSLHDELRWLYNRIMEQKEPGFKWDYAVTSEYDRVFPAGNQKAYWGGQPSTKHLVLPLNHYLFHNWSDYNDFIKFVQNWEGRKKTRKAKR
jgi:malonyl-CoA O-methyltransferase/biotin synthesis protein BioG